MGPSVAARFPISFTGVGRPLALLGLSRRNCWVEVGPTELTVRMGWGFRMAAPRTSVRAVAHDDRPVRGWGAHGWAGRWLVNGSSKGVVRVDLVPAGLGSVFGAAVRVDELRVSVEDPDGLIRALQPSS